MFKKAVVMVSFLLGACTWCAPECPYIGSFEPTTEQTELVSVTIKKKVNQYTGGGNYSKLFTDALIAEIEAQGILRLVPDDAETKADYEIDLHAYASHKPEEFQACKIFNAFTLGLIPCWEDNTYYINVDIVQNKTGFTEGFTYQQSIVEVRQLFALIGRSINPERYSEEGVRKAITSQVLERLNQFIYNGGLAQTYDDESLKITDMESKPQPVAAVEETSTEPSPVALIIDEEQIVKTEDETLPIPAAEPKIGE